MWWLTRTVHARTSVNTNNTGLGVGICFSSAHRAGSQAGITINVSRSTTPDVQKQWGWFTYQFIKTHPPVVLPKTFILGQSNVTFKSLFLSPTYLKSSSVDECIIHNAIVLSKHFNLEFKKKIYHLKIRSCQHTPLYRLPTIFILDLAPFYHSIQFYNVLLHIITVS